jgi:glutathione S-transferase
MQSMKLFWTPASPFVRKVVVAAIELNLRDQIDIHPTFWPHEWGSRTVALDPEFAAANPIGRIPALVTKEGVAIPESNWICEYLDTLSVDKKLLPPSGAARWRCVRMLAVADGATEAMILRRAELLRETNEQSPGFLGKQKDRIFRCFDTIESEFDALDGDLTLAQISTAIACSYMEFRYPADNWTAGYPKLSAWSASFSQRLSMTQTMPAETPQRASESVA